MPKTETVDHNGRAIRAHRQAKGLTLAELAKLVGSTPQTLSNIEHRNRRCSRAMHARIAKALGLSEQELLAMPDGPTPLVMSVADVATELGCSESHVRRLISEGELRYVDIAHSGSRVKARIRRDDLEDFIEARTVAAPIPA